MIQDVIHANAIRSLMRMVKRVFRKTESKCSAVIEKKKVLFERHRENTVFEHFSIHGRTHTSFSDNPCELFGPKQSRLSKGGEPL